MADLDQKQSNLESVSNKHHSNVNKASIQFQHGLLQPPTAVLHPAYIKSLLTSISLIQAVCWIVVLLISASSTVLIISELPWYNRTFPQHYFKVNTYVLLEDTAQPFLLSVIAALSISLMYSPELSYVALQQIGIPSAIVFVSGFSIVYWIFDVTLVWYCADGPLLCLQYIIVCTATIYRLATLHKKKFGQNPNNLSTYDKCKLFKWVVVPITWLFLTIAAFGGPGLEFYLSLTQNYQSIFRLLIWPPLIQFTLGFAEKLLLKVSVFNNNMNNNSGKLHAVLLAQSLFAIFGRVMIFSGKNLPHAILLAAGHCLQEILFHRWSRQICRINYEIKIMCNKFFCGKCRSNKPLIFTEYFNSDKYKDYRSYIINIEYLIEIIGILTTSLIFITFYKYHYVFNFDYPLDDKENKVDVQFVIYIGLLQLLFEIVSYAIITYVESHFNKIQLISAWTKLNHLQMLSSTIIIIEAVVSAATVTRSVPNIVNCSNKNDVCSCSFAVDWEGC